MASPSRTSRLSLLILAALSLCFQLPSIVQVEASEFDLFVLSLHWSAEICRTSTKPSCCFDNQCCRFDSPPEFVINGLWPDYANGSWPSCCAISKFDEAKVSPLIPALMEYWPDLYCTTRTRCSGKKGSPWAFAWEYYGTCASPVLKDEYSYFLKALDLYFQYNLTKALTDANILGSNSVRYPLAKIVRTIKAAVGASPALLCNSESLREVRLCFNKDFTLRSCGASESNYCPPFIALPTRSVEPRDGDAADTWLGSGGTFEPLIRI